MKQILLGKSPFTRRQRVVSVLICLAAFILALLLFFVLDGFRKADPFRFADNQIQNYFFNIRNARQVSHVFEKFGERLVIVKIDEKTLADKRFKQWPFPRTFMASMLNRLNKGRPKVIGLDIIYSEYRNREQDAAMAAALRGMDNLVLPIACYMGEGRMVIKKPIELFLKALGNREENYLGYTYEHQDPDGVVRRAPLILHVGGKPYLSLDILLLARYLDIPLEKVREVAAGWKHETLLGDRRIPTNEGTMYINYAVKGVESLLDRNKLSQLEEEVPGSRIIDYVSFCDLMDPQKMPDDQLVGLFRDKIVLVGVTAAAGEDIKKTPLGDMPGVEIHANIILTALEGKFIVPIGTLPAILILLGLALLMGAVLPRLNPRLGTVFTVLLAGGGFFAAFSLFSSKGLIVPVSLPLFTVFLCFVGVNIYHYQSEQHAKKRLSNLLKEFAPMPSEIIEEALASRSGGARVGGTKTELSILFSDIRGYTDLSERLDPVAVMDTLNEYHGAMGDIFAENGGVIFDYQGDAQMVVFGLVPPSTDNHAAYAIRAALTMQKTLEDLREKWLKEGKHVFEIGVGICSGEVSLGIVGSAQRKQYAAIGDSTNVAARLQGMSKQLNSPVLISETAFIKAGEYLEADKLEPVRLKGKSEPLQVYRAKSITIPTEKKK